jgi:hypothetical protein
MCLWGFSGLVIFLLLGMLLSTEGSHTTLSASNSLLSRDDRFGETYGYDFQREDLSAFVCAVSTNKSDVEGFLDWLADTGASCHFCNDASRFVSMRKCDISIKTAKKGEVLKALGIGNVLLTTRNVSGELETIPCHDTLYVPEARRNLLSTSKLSKSGYQFVLPTPENQKFPAGIHNCRKGKEQSVVPIYSVGDLYAIQTIPECEISRNHRKQNAWIVWHRRLGFMHFETMRAMTSASLGMEELEKIPMPRNYVSPNVKMGKATNIDIPKPNFKRADKPLQRVHMDVLGPTKTPSFNGHHYCCVFVNDCSRYSWCYTMKKKSEVLSTVQRFYADTAILRQNFPLCCLRRDNAGENSSKAFTEWLNEKGIRSEFSTAFEPWQDGRAEVHIRVICNIARTNMIASGLKGRFWARALSYTTDISNIH